ncbi:hypothetical protein GY14_30925 [Delftia tsuruhatensis]|nr:hypothetical protein GY14_30925 [Delftia tsuruhatensis]
MSNFGCIDQRNGLPLGLLRDDSMQPSRWAANLFAARHLPVQFIQQFLLVRMSQSVDDVLYSIALGG